MTKLTIPFEKKDVHYDSGKKEVSLSVEKFDALVKFIQDLLHRVEEAEDRAGIFRYRAREAQASASVLQSAFEKVRGEVSEWLASDHTIQELADRAGIPYATCYRIVKERLAKGSSADTGDLQKIEVVVSEDLKKAYQEIGDDTVLLPRPGEVFRNEDIYKLIVTKELAPDAPVMTGKEILQKLRQGTLLFKLVDVSSGKTQPVEVEDFQFWPTKRAGRGCYRLRGKVDFAKRLKNAPKLERDLEKSKS
jgi:hypothetical protein